MTPELLTAFVVYAFVSFITPGPNNVMLLTSGANFGLRRSLPHISGVAGGFAAMTFIVGLGFGAVFSSYPILYTLLQYIGVAYLLYLAWKIAGSGSIATTSDGNTSRKPLSFLSAAAFQWVNPKAWMIVIATISVYVPHHNYFTNMLLVTLLFCLIGFPSATLWTTCGTLFRRFFAHEKYMKIFNISMALLLVSSVYPVIKKMLF